MTVGFDNNKYVELQSEHIQQRIAQFGGKLYLEFGGKLFDDYHASRVLPGFAPDSKLRMLSQLKGQAEVVIAINAADIEKNKIRGDLGITYDVDVLRLMDAFRSQGLYVGSVVITRWAGQTAAANFQRRLEDLSTATTPSRATPTTSPSSSPTTATARTTTSRPPAPWWWSPPPARVAGRWRCACPRSTTSTSGAPRPVTPSLRPSPSGTSPWTIR